MPHRTVTRARSWLPLLLGVGALYGVLALGNSGTRRADGAAEDKPASAGAAGSLLDESPHAAQARRLLSNRGPDAIVRRIEAYGAWASVPDTREPRRALLESLFTAEHGSADLPAVLAAIEADPTPPEHDPLWSFAIEKLSLVWQGPRADRGLELLVGEPRPRARRAVVSSFAHLVDTERAVDLSAEQRQTLINHFIDLHPRLAPEQQPEVNRALRTIAGDDVADVLLGRGLTSDHELNGARERNEALANTRATLAKTRHEGTQ